MRLISRLASTSFSGGSAPVTGQQFDLSITPVNDLPVFGSDLLAR